MRMARVDWLDSRNVICFSGAAFARELEPIAATLEFSACARAKAYFVAA